MNALFIIYLVSSIVCLIYMFSAGIYYANKVTEIKKIKVSIILKAILSFSFLNIVILSFIPVVNLLIVVNIIYRGDEIYKDAKREFSGNRNDEKTKIN